MPKITTNSETGQRRCAFCKTYKSLLKFKKVKNKKVEFRYDSYCNDCKETEDFKELCRNRNRQSRKSNINSKSEQRNRQLLRDFNITLNDFNILLEKQNNCCAICNINSNEYYEKYNKVFAVDHNHKSNKIRGLLCHNCNTSLGLLKEKEQTIFKLLEYLQKDYANIKLNEGKFKIKSQLILKEEENLIEIIETEYQ